VLSIALGAASSGQIKEAPWRSIHVNPERRLSDYVTYRWNPAQRPVDKSNHQVITAAIEAHLKKRGYVLDEVDPDIYVSYSLDLQEEELSRPGEYRDRRHGRAVGLSHMVADRVFPGGRRPEIGQDTAPCRQCELRRSRNWSFRLGG
jgi:hypothetical protein